LPTTKGFVQQHLDLNLVVQTPDLICTPLITILGIVKQDREGSSIKELGAKSWSYSLFYNKKKADTR